MHRVQISQPFHLDHTLDSGQVFRWRKTGNTWKGIVNSSLIQVSQHDFIYSNCDEAFLSTYFRLDDDLDKILSSINKDENISKAITLLYGLRLIRQDPWECLISFICSSFNNVPRIKPIVETMCRAFGRKCEHGYTFPTPEALSRASLSQLRKCGLGYRDRYISETAKIVAAGFCLGKLRSEPYDTAKRTLMDLPGVGQKVADCVLLFSLDFLEAFPCDVNIQKCVTQFYGPCVNIREFGQEYFGEYAGYANHYLYHYHRLHRQRR